MKSVKYTCVFSVLFPVFFRCSRYTHACAAVPLTALPWKFSSSISRHLYLFVPSKIILWNLTQLNATPECCNKVQKLPVEARFFLIQKFKMLNQEGRHSFGTPPVIFFPVLELCLRRYFYLIKRQLRSKTKPK
uniref:Uncharacterized protein n=1 Tax=Ixodes ricinus TaxID=34613 RepID=A0A6B0US75_IXORI